MDTSTPPSSSSSLPTPDQERQNDEEWFTSTPLPDLTFSFKPRQLRLTRSEDMLRDWKREGAGEGEEEVEGKFSLRSQSESEGEQEGSEGVSENEEDEDGCQIIEARTPYVESRKREEGNEGNEGTPSDRKEERRLLKVSTGTQGSANRSGSTNQDSFIDPLMARPLPSPTCDYPPSSPASFLPSSLPPSPRTPTSPFPFASSSGTPSPPKHDLTGRPLPSAPPPLLPFDIPSSPAPRSPRQRFSSTKSFARSLSQRRKGKEDEEDTMQSQNSLRSYWDSTMETDRTIDSVKDSSRRSRLRIPLPSPIPFPSNSSLSLPTPPPRSYAPEPTSPSQCRSSYFTALPDSRTPPTRTPTSSSFQFSPRPSSPTTPTSLHPSFSISHSSNPPQRFPTPLAPSFPLAPLSIPPSASSSSFPLPPSYPQTPTSAFHSHEDHSLLYPPPTPVPSLPKFISVFIDPSYHQSYTSFPPSATQSTATHSIRRRNPSLSANNFDVSDEKLVDSKRRTMKWLNEVSYEDSFTQEGSSGSIGKGGRKKRVRIREGWMKRLKRFGKSNRGKWIVIFGILGAVLLVIVIGVIVGMRKEDLGECGCENGGKPLLEKGICSCSCREGWGGTRCDLDGTCVEVETVQGTERIARGLIDLAQSTSSLWSPSIDVPRLAYTLHHYASPYYSSSPTIDCSAQLSLLDVPSLILYPTRLSFAQSALLHTLSLTESNSTYFRLQHFISSLDFSQFGDSPSPTRNSNFQIISGGFTWDCASLERLVQDVKWEDLVNAGEEEMTRMEGKLEGLERVTGYAVASHAQRGEALKHYWMDTLGREEEELDRFREKVRSARIVIPFEEDVKFVEERIARRNNSISIVEGTGCRAGLSEDMIERVNEIEDGVLGLPRIDSNGSGDCSIRPIYGFLDLFSLSSPVSSASPAQASLILTQSVTPRLTYHAGPLLSLENASSSSPTPVTIEQFGLYNQLDHVLLDYLDLLEVERAKLVLDYVLSSTTDLSSSDSRLAGIANGLEGLPLMGLQVWGGIKWDEVDEVTSGT